MRKLLLPLVPLALVFYFPACEDDAGGTTVGATSSSSGMTSGMGGSGADGGMGSVGGSGGAGGAGGTTSTGGMGGSSNCTEMGQGEPNETEANALQLADVANDCDSSGSSVLGTLDGNSDVDWYFYEMLNDSGACLIDPTVDFSQAVNGAAELCMYFECVAGGYPTVNSNDCLDGSTQSTSPGGRPGCCGAIGFEVDLALSPCQGSNNDELYVYLKISEPGAQADNCNQYNITYRL